MMRRLRFALALALATVSVGCDRARAPEATADASQSASASAVPAAAATPSPVASSAIDPARVRETKSVVVDGVTETWRLVWGSAPKPACVDATWSSCDCQAFAFAETGPLSLVRSRPGQPDETLDLGEIEGHGTLPRIRKTAPLPTDKGKQPTAAELGARPASEVMKLADFDGDGRASEFVYVESDRKGIDKCGKVRAVVIGVSKSNPKLHVFRFRVVENGKTLENPLHLDLADWEELRTKKKLASASWGCDHGATSHPVSTIAPSAPSAPGAVEFVDTTKDEPCN
jgi:hypothetical protein